MMILVNRLPSLGLPVCGAVRVAAVQAKPFLQQAVSGRWELLTGGPTAPRKREKFEIEDLEHLSILKDFEKNLPKSSDM